MEKEIENQVNGIESVINNTEVANARKRLADLRANGVNLIRKAEEEISNIKANRILSKEEKTALIEEKNQVIKKAKEVAKQNKDEISKIESATVKLVKELSKPLEKKANEVAAANIKGLKEKQAAGLKEAKDNYSKAIAAIKEKYAGASTEKERDEKEVAIKEAKVTYKATVHDVKNDFNNAVQYEKDVAHELYMERRTLNIELRNGKETFAEKEETKIENFKYQFKASKFFLANALYITIILIYIACIIIAPISGKGNLLSLSNILQILEQSSARMFFALGVAGLILLGGTDLSIGRQIALGTVVTSIILHDGLNIVTFFGWGPWDFSNISMGIRVAVSLVLSIVLCVICSGVAGFFTARFKMHPFITTLSTQLLIYGSLYVATNGTPTGGVESGIKDLIGGRIRVGSVYVPKNLIYAVITIFVVWFIWNKTKFGKNMYAVGGNSEAAAVSGINVFKTTLLVFLMAGVLYGLGAFLQAFRSNASAGTGQGWETDAIAACVVGGISFSGGVGKIKGAVIGVIIFTGLTYCLSYLGVDTNLQFIFKGIIIMAACALDSVKNIKRK